MFKAGDVVFTVCKSCNKKFKYKIKEKVYSKGIKEQYFSCPHCKYRYSLYWEDKKARQMQRDIEGALQGDKIVVGGKVRAMQEAKNAYTDSLRQQMLDKFKLEDWKLDGGDDSGSKS